MCEWGEEMFQASVKTCIWNGNIESQHNIHGKEAFIYQTNTSVSPEKH